MPIELGQQRGQAEYELGLGRGAGDHLMGHVLQRVGLGVEAVADLGVAEREAALVRHVHVVEDHHRVRLVEPGAERVVEVRAAVVEGLAGDEPQPGRVDRDREGERVRLVLRRAAQHRGGEHQQFVGERADRGEHPGAADHDAVVVLADDVRHQRAAALLAAGHRPVGLRRDQRVGAQQVLVAHLFVVRGDVAGEGGVRLAEPVGGGREGHQGAVQVVAGAPEHAVRRLGPDAERLPPLDEVLLVARYQEGRAHRVAGARRRVGQHVAVRGVVLHVEQPRVGAHDVAEGWVRSHAPVQRLALYLHLCPGPGEPLKELRAGPCGHACSPHRVVWAIFLVCRAFREGNPPRAAWTTNLPTEPSDGCLSP